MKLDFSPPRERPTVKGGIYSRQILGPHEVLLVEKLAACLNLAQIADYLRISERTFHNIKKAQPEVEEAYKRGRALAINGVGKSLIARALSGDVKAQQFFLATQGGWKRTEVHEHTGKDGGPIRTLRDVSDLIDDELMGMIEDDEQS
jgi:hypothetical protein